MLLYDDFLHLLRAPRLRGAGMWGTTYAEIGSRGEDTEGTNGRNRGRMQLAVCGEG